VHNVLESFFQKCQEALKATEIGKPWETVLALAEPATAQLHEFVNLFDDPAFVEANLQHSVDPAVLGNLETGISSWSTYLLAMSI